MERRAAEAAEHEDQPEHQRRVGQADEAQHDHRDQRARHHQHPRPPAIGERAEASCDTEFAIWKHIASVPAVASDRFECGISSGSSGA